MSKIFFEELGLKTPDINLNVGSGSHGNQTASIIVGIETAILKEKPDGVVVFGDTNSTLAGALAASKLGVPVLHIEAGLRSFNRSMPEEQNRVVTDHLSTFLFAPTEIAVRNLAREGIDAKTVFLSGDVMLDAATLFARKANESSNVLDRYSLAPNSFVLATLHRAANTDDPRRLQACLDGLALVSQVLPVVLPLHPRTRATLSKNGICVARPASLMVVEPQGYLDMLQLIQNASVVATDSGGLQKEAFFFKRPCVTLRGETEWVELIESGWNRLCETDSPNAILNTIIGAIGKSGSSIMPYGCGNAANDICAIISQV